MSNKGKSISETDKILRVMIRAKQERIEQEMLILFLFFKNNDENKLITMTSSVHNKTSQITSIIL